ncbi:hypothetical protein ma163 [Moumouvirus australiensis]|uniref:DUF5894 domain-containing protein n=1 Tax=Moumouvirus australiensis TaxID=2109587 RepID=A0A2P1EKX9_9VIRU|nr:hypothetical protein QKC55_gp741 [Moumouvirus australiensis]AVL94549.1 hypothetical protein ma163 [Moumouvirus australiensis]
MDYIYSYFNPIIDSIHFFLEFEDEDNKTRVNMFDLLNMKAPNPDKVLIVDIKNNNIMLGVCAWAKNHGYQFHVTKTNIFNNYFKDKHFYDPCKIVNLSQIDGDENVYNTVIIGYQLGNFIHLNDDDLYLYEDDMDLLQEISNCHIKLMTLKKFLKIYHTPKCINMF